MKKLIAVITALSLTACAQPGQDRYGHRDVGKATIVKYGTVIDTRPVEITGENHGVGAAAGVGAGALAGSFVGSGGGNIGAVIAGALIAGLAGHAIEQEIDDRKGIEYTIDLESGDAVTVAQNVNPEDKPIGEGDRVMVQTSGEYMRVLPAPKKTKQKRRA